MLAGGRGLVKRPLKAAIHPPDRGVSGASQEGDVARQRAFHERGDIGGGHGFDKVRVEARLSGRFDVLLRAPAREGNELCRRFRQRSRLERDVQTAAVRQPEIADDDVPGLLEFDPRGRNTVRDFDDVTVGAEHHLQRFCGVGIVFDNQNPMGMTGQCTRAASDSTARFGQNSVASHDLTSERNRYLPAVRENCGGYACTVQIECQLR